jgi:hypothetical protein
MELAPVSWSAACFMITGMKTRDRLIRVVVVAALLAMVPLTVVARDPLPTDPPLSPFLSGKTSTSGTEITDHLAISSGLSNDLVSQPPMVTGRYTLNGQTVMPYIGAGFGGGETTDPNRAVVRESVRQQDRLITEPIGKTLVPNEFQLGVRIPF